MMHGLATDELIRTPARVAFLREHWTGNDPTDWIVQKFNELPGKPATPRQIYEVANRIHLKRPAKMKGGTTIVYRPAPAAPFVIPPPVVRKEREGHLGGPDFPLPGRCQWPRGDSPRWDFCGEALDENSRSWCAAHNKRAYERKRP